MSKYNFIDHEDYKVKVKLSASTNFLLLQDMDRFGFIKKNEDVNINAFINHILPLIYKYRIECNKKLKNFLHKKYNIQNNELIDGLNSLYFEDNNSYMNETLNLRITKSNMNLFDQVFSDGTKKKSTYIRQLINQYSNMKLDMREILCFNDVYKIIDNCVEKYNTIINTENESINCVPIDIVTYHATSEVYVVVLFYEDKIAKIKSIRLCDIYKVVRKDTVNLNVINYFEDKISDYMSSFSYIDEATLKLGEIRDGNI